MAWAKKMLNYPIRDRLIHLKLAFKHPEAGIRHTFRRFLWLNKLGATHSQVNKLRLELNTNGAELIQRLETMFGTSIGEKRQPELYVICRLLKPSVVVETGVQHGISSAFLLLALEKNRQGTLYSVELAETLQSGVRTGWFVPHPLRSRWELTIGDSLKVLPRLLNKISPIDIFFHDSEHTYSFMMREFEIAWPHIRMGGLLLSDDTGRNEAFIDFSEKMGRKPMWTEDEYGMIVK